MCARLARVGIYGRDYMRDGSSGSLGLSGISVNTKLLIVNAVLWFLFAGSLSWGGIQGGLYRFIQEFMLLHPPDVFGKLRLWEPFTAFWFHDPTDLSHVFFNMLFLFFFGRPTEAMLGGKRYLRLYLAAGLASTLALLTYSLLAGRANPGLGASGCVYGVGVFLALRAPNLPVYFFFLRMPLWVLVGVFMVGREVVNLAVLHHHVGATVAHLAGAAYGYAAHRLYGYGIPRAGGGGGGWLDAHIKRRASTKAATDARSAKDVRARVDELLDKIKAEGIGALSDQEKDFLERASQRFGR